MTAVSFHGVAKSYGAQPALQDASFAAAPGEFLTLLGPSGCGKTTALRILAGLERNDAGVVRIGDRVVSDPARGIFEPPEARHLGMVFQSYAIWPHLTVFENVAYPLEARGVARADIAAQVDAVLRRVSLEALADRNATALSGGQQQRVAIARALVHGPAVLLMDEPLSNLDAVLRERMRTEFRQLQQELGVTTIFVTHDQDEAMLMSDRIVVMKDGCILQVGTPVEIYHRPVSVRVAEFFGSPNVLGGRAQSVATASGACHVKFTCGTLDGTADAYSPVPEGAKVIIIARPEAFQVSATKLAAAGGLHGIGVIREVRFGGPRHTLLIAAGDITLQAVIPGPLCLAAGDRVYLHIPREQLVLLPS